MIRISQTRMKQNRKKRENISYGNSASGLNPTISKTKEKYFICTNRKFLADKFS
jgi:hypothetical protein